MPKVTEYASLAPELVAELEKRRSTRGLRALSEEESGSGHERLPAGVYGFTYSPCEDNFPLFNRRDLRSYETHKLKDGSVVLLGFLTASDKNELDGGKTANLHLFAEPKDDAAELVEVPLARVVKHVEASQRKGTGLEIQVSG